MDNLDSSYAPRIQEDVPEIRLGTVYGVGTYVAGKYVASVVRNGRRYTTREYSMWKDMIRRSHCKKFKALHSTYASCEASTAFNDFQGFCQWGESQIGFLNEGYALDKDILVKGNKVYSQEMCVFVPHEINSLVLTAGASRGGLPIGVRYHKVAKKYLAQISVDGKHTHLGSFTEVHDAFNAYKLAKESNIKAVAHKWRGLIDDRAYAALCDYEVLIDD